MAALASSLWAGTAQALGPRVASVGRSPPRTGHLFGSLRRGDVDGVPPCRSPHVCRPPQHVRPRCCSVCGHTGRSDGATWPAGLTTASRPSAICGGARRGLLCLSSTSGGVSTSRLTWRRGGSRELERIYTGDDHRLVKILTPSVDHRRSNRCRPRVLRERGYASGWPHFNDAGISAVAVTGQGARNSHRRPSPAETEKSTWCSRSICSTKAWTFNSMPCCSCIKPNGDKSFNSWAGACVGPKARPA